MNNHVHPVMKQILAPVTPPDPEPWPCRLQNLARAEAERQEEMIAEEYRCVPDPDHIEEVEDKLCIQANPVVTQAGMLLRQLRVLFPTTDPDLLWDLVNEAADEPVVVSVAKSLREQKQQLSTVLGGKDAV